MIGYVKLLSVVIYIGITALQELFTQRQMNDSNMSDYSPFPSKIFALMFMLANSPRPIVSIILVHA